MATPNAEQENKTTDQQQVDILNDDIPVIIPHSVTPHNSPNHQLMHSTFSPSPNIMHDTLSPVEPNIISPNNNTTNIPINLSTSANPNSMIKYTQQYKKSLKKKKNKKRNRALHIPNRSTSKSKSKSKSKNKSRNKNKHDLKNGRTTISKIEIYDIINDDDLEYKQQLTEEKSIHTKQYEAESDFNDSILSKSKRPYYLLIFITVLCIGVFVMNFVDLLTYFLYNGLMPSALNIVILIPIWICFRYVENKIKFQFFIIGAKIEETYDLKKKLQSKIDENLLQQKKIKQYKLAIKEQEIEIQKLKSKLNPQSISNEMDSCNQINFNKLLHGFRKGQMEIQIEFADNFELMHMLNIVVSCISLLPFGMLKYRTELKRILEQKIEQNGLLKQHFYFFMLSYLHCIDVQRLFRKHKIMKKVKKVHSLYYKSDNMEHKHIISSDTVTFEEKDNDRVQFNKKDPIKLFRTPFDHFAKVGFTVIIPKQNENAFYDPINGNRGISKLSVRSIFNSNAKPYQIDCYGKDNKLSSTFILKKGDDLRKDEAVLQMFKFMNCIWRENDCKYMENDDKECDEKNKNKNKKKKKIKWVQCLIYKVIPIGIDFGIIEMKRNCIELNKIMTLKPMLSDGKNIDKFQRLIASSAGSFIGSFVCGIRDRHDDNILINTKKCMLFHIDYGYIFNNKTSLDTAKIAITSDLKKIFQIYKYGWSDFVDLCVCAWMILRQNASELIDFARVVLAFLYPQNEIEIFLRESLKLDMNNDKAKEYIRDKVQNAPKQWKTKMKNLVHGFAQKIKS